MLNMREIADYGPCYVVAINCPANGHDLPRKATLFDVCDGATHETLDAFRTARQAKKFAHRYIADPTGVVQQKRQLSADRIIHNRALWAVSLLSNFMEYDITITDKHNPKAEPKCYYASEIFITTAENKIMVQYYVDNEIKAQFMYISKIKAVRAISENTFEFETYKGKVYTINGID